MALEVAQHESWQQDLLESYSSVEELERAGLLSDRDAERLRALGARFRVRVPRYYAALMDRSAEGRERCPIRAQAIPSLGEQDPLLPEWARRWSARAFGRETPWIDDAIGDLARLAAPRLTHRYGNRAIVHVSSLCAMYCRFCFRKSHLNDAERTLYDGSLDPALEYVAAHPEIRELILTGGDPISLPDAWLARFLARVETIHHVRHVRVHSRMAATLPSRLTPELARALSGRRFVVSLVSHFNHPREWTPEARRGLRRLREAGVPLYNQSVLLRGVNDHADTLASLFQALYEDGVAPFYLHHPDWTPGTFAYRAPVARGLELMRELRGRLSGPALPEYVLDTPGGLGKVALTSATKLDERVEDGLGGALYELTPSNTRDQASGPRLYAEFWKA
ncbi:MAG: KamA family radical SAM protein [Deltaproteobacteria bacterium]|nr:KamA family radical SAM protein [Deltaproteobacteria bacterium]